MNPFNTPYTAGIEKLLLDHVSKAEISIYIAVAWFTNNTLKDALIQAKKRKPSLIIEIVVDDNITNEKYFLDYKDTFRDSDIIIHSKARRKFLHNKFMLVDGAWSISGSYNYTNKAKANSEQVVESNSVVMYNYLLRVFKYLTNTLYMDESVILLFKYPEFGRSIISSFYSFTKPLYRRHKDKIAVGYCWTVDNGSWDTIHRSPGILFNNNIKFIPELRGQEFAFPVTKENLQDWTEARNTSIILEYYQDKPGRYDEISDELIDNNTKVIAEFNAKLKQIYDFEELEKLICTDPDIIIEDYIWLANFLPFLHTALIDSFFSTIGPLQDSEFTDLI